MGLKEVYVHAILDGRDVPPKSALTYFRELEEKFSRSGRAKWPQFQDATTPWTGISAGTGWRRPTAAWQKARASGQDAEEAVRNGYERGESDEFLKPTVVDPAGLVQDGDSIIFFNFRPDRAREITRAFVDDFSEFPQSP